MLCLVTNEEEKRNEMNSSKEMRKKRKEINSLMYVWTQGEKGKKNRRMYFFFLCLVCHIEGNEKKIYVFFHFYAHINVQDV